MFQNKRVFIGLFVVVVVSIIGALWSFGIVPPKPHKVSLPSYVALVLIGIEEDRFFGFGSGFLVDKERGIIATSAHIVNAGPYHQVILDGKKYKVKTDEDSINWVSDVALLFLENYEAEELPEPPIFEKENAKKDEKVQTLGYATPRDIKREEILFLVGKDIVPCVRRAQVKRPRGPKIGFYSCPPEVFRLLLQLRRGESIPKEERHWFFANYIILGGKAGREGLSGGPVVNSQGKIIGVSSASNGETIVAPIWVVDYLCVRVKSK